MFSIATIGLGLAPVKIFQFEIYRLFIMLAILASVAINNSPLTYSITLSFMFGVAIGSFSLVPVAEFVIIALLAGIFTLPNKFKICFVVLLSDV